MNDADDQITVRDLVGAPRGAFVLVGMAALLAGSFAVFKSSNQAGTVALLAVGAIASLLAVVGKVPLKWVIGGHEFDMSHRAARAAAEVVASHLPPSETAELAGRLADADGGRLSPMTGAMLDYVNFERAAIARVISVVQQRGWQYVDASARDRGADGFIIATGGQAVAVEYKLVRSREMLARRVRELVNRHRASTDKAVVIVISGSPPASASGLAHTIQSHEGHGLHVVFMEDPHFEGSLTAAVEQSPSSKE